MGSGPKQRAEMRTARGSARHLRARAASVAAPSAFRRCCTFLAPSWQLRPGNFGLAASAWQLRPGNLPLAAAPKRFFGGRVRDRKRVFWQLPGKFPATSWQLLAWQPLAWQLHVSRILRRFCPWQILVGGGQLLGNSGPSENSFRYLGGHSNCGLENSFRHRVAYQPVTPATPPP